MPGWKHQSPGADHFCAALCGFIKTVRVREVRGSNPRAPTKHPVQKDRMFGFPRIYLPYPEKTKRDRLFGLIHRHRAMNVCISVYLCKTKKIGNGSAHFP